MKCHRCGTEGGTFPSRYARLPLCLSCWNSEISRNTKAWYSGVLTAEALQLGNEHFPGIHYLLTRGSAVLFPARPQGGEWALGRIYGVWNFGLSKVSIKTLSDPRDIPEALVTHVAAVSAAWEPAREWRPSLSPLPEGWLECPHCNGHGSSLHDPEGVDTCTACEGVGVLRPRENPAQAPAMAL